MEHIQSHQPSRNAFAHRLTVGILLMANGFFVLFATALVVDNSSEVENHEWGAAIFALTAIIGTLLLLDPVRVAVSVIFPKQLSFKNKRLGAVVDTVFSPIERMLVFAMPMLRDGEMIVEVPEKASTANYSDQEKPYPDKPELLGFDPHNTIHMLAVVMCVFVLGLTMASFALEGGLSGQATAISLSAFAVILQFVLTVGVAFLGVGVFFRRSWSETMQRLGLDKFSWFSVAVGTVAAFALLGALLIMAGLWVSIAGSDTVNQQSKASEAISDSVTTIWVVLLISITSSVGEEIAFRGALQPIFGIWPTTIFFVLLHTQYALTPAALIIAVPAIAFAYLRRHYNLYAAISAHFVYNFIQLLGALATNTS